MNEESPMTQQQWIERLSAYLDDEVDEAERQEIERLVTTHPDLAEQLVQLRRMTRELSAWRVDAPRVPDGLIESVRSFEDAGQTSIQYRRQTLAAGLRYAAVLLAGMLLGMAIVRSSDFTKHEPGASLPLVATATGHPAIPPDAAETLLREAAMAARLKGVESLVRQGRYEAAAREYEALEKEGRGDGVATARGTVSVPRGLALWRAFQERRGT
jgi:anti-sigma factor RsiW